MKDGQQLRQESIVLGRLRQTSVKEGGEMRVESRRIMDAREWQTKFAVESNGSIHRKGREERKARLHESLYLEEIIRQGQKGSGVLTVHDVINISPIFIIN